MRSPALIAGVCLASVALACRSNSGAAGTQSAAASSAPAAEERTVPVVAVVSRPVERTLPLPGDLLAFQDVAIHARVQGFLQAVPVDRGSVVRRGALLARIDAPELRAQLSEADAKVQAAEAQLLEARAVVTSERSTFDRLKRASNTPGAVAGNDVDVAQQRVEAANARVAAATKNVEAAQEAARSVRDVEAYLQVTAPFDGVVTERAAHVGSLVSPNSGPIVRMQQVSPLRVVAAIPEAYVAGLSLGQLIEFTVATFPGETFTGKLARLARALDLKTRTMAVELDVDNAAGRLAPGMFAEIRWPARRESASLLVPRTAVATTTERTFVVRVKDSTVEWVDVKRGASLNDLTEVFGNVNAGDQVAVRATDELRAGTKVRPALQAAK
ncbi:MAG: efflux RND transporter periplasmic adaptor subunit [Vicinamibacterales bacterium]